MVAMRSPFCGYNAVYFAELRDKDLVCYSNKIKLEFVEGNVYTIVNLPTKRISVTSQQGTFIRLVLTRWRLKPYSIDMERNCVTVAPCIRPLTTWSRRAIESARLRGVYDKWAQSSQQAASGESHLIDLSNIFPTAAFLFLLQDWLYMIPQTFTVTSEHIRFYFLVFLYYTFSCCFRVVDSADSCRLSSARLDSISYRIVHNIGKLLL